MDTFMEYDYPLPEVSPVEDVMLASENPKKRAGRKKFNETRHPVYRGVRSRNNGKWVCEVRHPVTQARVWLGTHPTAEMAARAHDVAALAMRGRSPCLNFADSVWRLPVPESDDVRDIQRAAAEAAAAFGPTEVVVNVQESMVLPGDEEEIFGGYLDSMAEGFEVQLPPMMGHDHFMENVELCDEWNF